MPWVQGSKCTVQTVTWTLLENHVGVNLVNIADNLWQMIPAHNLMSLIEPFVWTLIAYCGGKIHYWFIYMGPFKAMKVAWIIYLII